MIKMKVKAHKSRIVRTKFPNVPFKSHVAGQFDCDSLPQYASY